MATSYTKSVNCAICGTRKPRRFCPGVRGEICSICCGTEREESVDCPMDCEYLRAAHHHEKPPEVDLGNIPNAGIEVTDEFLEKNEWLLGLIGTAAVEGARTAPGTTDYDFRDAWERLIQKYRAEQSGLYIENRSPNPYASAVYERVEASIADIRKRIAEAGAPKLPDTVFLTLLIFLQRLEYLNNNGRRRSRAFYTFLSDFFMPENANEADFGQTAEEPEIVL